MVQFQSLVWGRAGERKTVNYATGHEEGESARTWESVRIRVMGYFTYPLVVVTIGIGIAE